MKKIIYAFVAITLLSSIKVQAQFPNIQRLLDSFALRQFYTAAGGASWTNNSGWTTPGSPMNSWFGITLTGNRVTGLNLPGNNLSGTVSPTTIVLTELQTIDLSNNNLGGTAATVAALLVGKTQLTSLNASHNSFSGNVTGAALNTLTSLTYLDLSNNNFSGTLPAITIPTIQQIYLDSNAFTGNIPASLGTRPALNTLFLNSNQLSGGIANLATSTSLLNLNLSANLFTGAIPPTLGNITSLQTLWLNNNTFSGAIPAELGNLSDLRILGFNHNALTGTIPASFSGLASIERINFRDNMIEGPLPAFLTGLPALNTLGLINNYFTFAGLEELVSDGSITVEYQDQKLVTLKYNPTSGNLSVDAGGTLANNTYTWYQVGNPTPVDTKTGNATYAPAASGTYYVEVTNSIATALTLRSKPKAVVVSAATSSTASIYPNPARNITTLSFKMEGNSVVKVTDRNGRVMSTSTVSNATNGSQVKLDVTRYNPGIYYVSITNGKDVQSVQLNKQ